MAADEPVGVDELWLGYNGAVAPFGQISAMLLYQPIWDRRLVQTGGSVPSGVQTVVLLTDGRVLPARFALADLHARWVAWQRRAAPSADRSDGQETDET